MFKKLRTSEFYHNVATLITGTTVAQAIPVFVSPILTRLYGPEDFGIYALYVGLASVLGAIATFNYEKAVLLPKENEKAVNVVFLSLFLALFLSFLSLIIFIIFGRVIANLLGNESLEKWLLLIPVTIFFNGLFNTLKYYNIRDEKYRIIAKATSSKSIFSSSTQVILGFLSFKPGGLIIGNVIMHFTANFKMTKDFLKGNFVLIRSIQYSKLKEQLFLYKDFPKYTTPSVFINTTSLYLIVAILAKLFGNFIVGQYSLVNRTLGLPSSIIGSAIGSVYIKNAIEEKNKLGNSKNTFINTFLLLISLGTIFFIPIYFFIEDVFSFVFGENWRTAGQISRYLIILIFIRFIVSPLSMTNQIYGNQKYDFAWQISLFLNTLIICVIAYFFSLNVKTFFLIYAIGLSCNYVVYGLLLFKASKGKKIIL